LRKKELNRIDIARKFSVSVHALRRHEIAHVRQQRLEEQGGAESRLFARKPHTWEENHVLISKTELESLRKRSNAYAGLGYVARGFEREYGADPVSRSFLFFTQGEQVHMLVMLDNQSLGEKLKRIAELSMKTKRDINEILDDCLHVTS
jgi:hypothetical protein